MKLIYELDNQKHEIVLEGQKEVLLGRGEGCDIIIPSSNISRTHAKFAISDKECKVMDAGSTNGIFINGAKVNESVLKEGDILKLGKFELRVEKSEPPAVPGQAPAKTAPAQRKLRRSSTIISVLILLVILATGTILVINYLNKKEKVPQPVVGQATSLTTYQNQLNQGIDNLIKALAEKQSFAPARQDFQKAAQNFPTAQTFIRLVDFLEIKGANPLRLPWNELELILLETLKTEHLTTKAQMFIEEKLTWAQDENQNARYYNEAHNNPNLETALSLLEQIAPDSVYRNQALVEIAEIKVKLRNKYLTKAERFIDEKDLTSALDYLNRAQEFSDINDPNIGYKKDLCKRNIIDGKSIWAVKELITNKQLNEALATIKTIDEESLYYKEARGLKSKIETLLPAPDEPIAEAPPKTIETTEPPESTTVENPEPEPESTPPPTHQNPPPALDPKKIAKQIDRLKQALEEKEKSTRIWAVRSLTKYPSSISGPILLKRLKDETDLAIRCAIVHSLDKIKYWEAERDLVFILKTKLKDYNIRPPEYYQQELEKLRKGIRDTDETPKKPKELRGIQKRIAETRKSMLQSYDQKLNLGLLYFRTMEALGQIKSQEATEELYRLVFHTSIPVAYMAMDTLKIINDPKATDLMAKGKLRDWEEEHRERINFALTELTTPYNRLNPHKGTEWILKSIYMLTQSEVNKPVQTSDRLMKTFTIMILLSNPKCNLYNFSDEDNLMIEFIDLANALKGNNPEIMLYDYDLLIKYIKDEILTRALYQTFGDVLKPPPPILIPSDTPEK